jgi:hypothetical protein
MGVIMVHDFFDFVFNLVVHMDFSLHDGSPHGVDNGG